MPHLPNPHRKTRSDHASETVEDYVEAILRLAGRGLDLSCECAPRAKTTDLARHFEVAQPTVTKILNRLHQEEYVCLHRRQFVHLTAKGEQVAAHSLRRHQTVVQFLMRLGVSETQAELDAEGVEHHLSSESLAAVERFIMSDFLGGQGCCHPH